MASLLDAPVRELLEGRYIASFASRNPDGSMHLVAVWYLFEGNNLYVATSSRSRKARNLQSNTSVSIMPTLRMKSRRVITRGRSSQNRWARKSPPLPSTRQITSDLVLPNGNCQKRRCLFSGSVGTDCRWAAV